jgi:predicted transposase YbfD/YdcC
MEAVKVAIVPNNDKRSLLEHFSELEDPRIDRNMRHNMMDIIAIAICAVIANANDWNEIETWAFCKKDWLKTFLFLPNGIPSHDTFNRFFSAVDPQKFLQCFSSWIHAIGLMVEGTIISIDGKRVRRSHDERFGKSALHLVSAWASDLHLSLGQVKTADKSNEITAIPELLNLLSIKGCIITIDAMGCQKEIAAQIIDKKADYVLALKGNHGNLYDDVKTYFDETEKTIFKGTKCNVFQTLEKDHGRIEKRTYVATNDIKWLNEKSDWKGLKSIVMVIAERKEKAKKSVEKRYYITSVAPNAEKIGQYIRSHWSIENKLHWQLDVNFKEDQSRMRTKNSGENFAAIRRMAISLLKQETTKKLSMKCKRLLAGWDNEYLLKILGVKAI